MRTKVTQSSVDNNWIQTKHSHANLADKSAANFGLKGGFNFVCLFCQESFPKLLAYLKHIRKHDMKQVHKCSICNRIVTGDENFKLHFEEKHAELVDYRKGAKEAIDLKDVSDFVLDIDENTDSVNSDYEDPDDLDPEDIKTEFDDDLISIECQQCFKSFSNIESLSEHIASHHTEGAEEQQVDDLNMDVQDPFYQSLKLPYNYIHLPQNQMYSNVVVQEEPPPLAPIRQEIVPAMVEQGVSDEFVEIKTEDPEPVDSGCQYTCQFCGHMFDKTSKLSQHLRLKHNGVKKTFKCEICNKFFTQSSSLNLHKRNKHSDGLTTVHHQRKPRMSVTAAIQEDDSPHMETSDIFECQECNKTFSKQSSLKQHYLVHKEIRPYVCHCGESFSQSCMLALHKLSHSNKTPKKCEYCFKEFAIADHHKRHVRVHTKERPFKCDICHKAFSQPNTLTQHYRTHTGLKPYQCQICSKSFSILNYLNNHMRVHLNSKYHSNRAT